MNLPQAVWVEFRWLTAERHAITSASAPHPCREANLMPPPRLIKRHDQFFKRLLERDGTAGALLRERLPPAVAGRFGPDAPELVAGSFVNRELQEHQTDRLYRARMVDGEIAFIYALIEHKSSPDPNVTLQLLGYMVQIWQWWIRQEGNGGNSRRRRLPPIFPIVVYHSEAEWHIPLDFIGGMDLSVDGALRPHHLNFSYSLADLGRIEDAELSREETLRIGFLILKHGSRDGDLRETLLKLGRHAFALGYDDLVALVRYILAEPNDVEAAIVQEVLKEIIPGQETRIMSIAAEQWKAEGMQIGEVKGKAAGIEAGKADLLLRLLRRRFGSLPESAQARVQCASEDQLNEWAEAVLDASTLDAVFGGRGDN
ncbi:putative transposase YdaD [Skermanella aerolata]|uniref:Rpn family recombination-promoting nuclease/putative transposase n=1 Tax=Skermanella aerolata TaxID=393310 RepID=UPI003D235FD6